MLAQEIESAKSISTRGRSIVCGTCFNGMVEVLIRGNGDKLLWVVLSPGETGELIHQLTASIGCTATITPRSDFLNHRPWNQNKQEEQKNVVATEKNIDQPSPRRTAKTA